MKLYEIKKGGKMYTAYVLSEKSRNELKKRFPPKFQDFIGHHITEKFGVPSDTKPPEAKDAKVVGYVNDDSLEALVVSLDGTTKRSDGSTYHITWSLDKGKGRKPVDSNKLLKKGFEKVTPFSIFVDPRVLR